MSDKSKDINDFVNSQKMTVKELADKLEALPRVANKPLQRKNEWLTGDAGVEPSTIARIEDALGLPPDYIASRLSKSDGGPRQTTVQESIDSVPGLTDENKAALMRLYESAKEKTKTDAS